MKPRNPGSRRKKIILYYILAVVLPGIFLGYLANRGIRNDQALREKESLKKLEMNSQVFFSAVDTCFIRFMDEQNDASKPSGSRQQDPSILALEVKDTGSSAKLISHQLLYQPAEFIVIRPKKPEPPNNLKEGFRLEYIEHDYPEALRFYQDRMLQTNDHAQKMQAMVASARLHTRMNQPVQAKAVYEEIRKHYSGSLLNGEIPLGLIASLEILKINQAGREDADIRNNSQQYLWLLLHPPCEYDKNQFDLFNQSFREIIHDADPVTDSLVRELDRQRVRTETIIRVLSRPDLAATSGLERITGKTNEISCTPINSPELTAVYLERDETNGVQTSVVIDFPVFMKSRSEELIRKIDAKASVNIKVEDNNGKTVISKINTEKSSFIAFPFPEDLPKWKLLLSENKPGFIATLFKAESGIYLFIFILIALLMALGFVFTIYTLNMELRLNKLKSEFISNVSHELKSPLTSIRMMTELLYHNRVQTEERKSAYYSTMLQESERLSHLIDNILDFSRMDEDRKKYDFTNLDLDELLAKFLESTRERLRDTGFSIRYDCPEKVPLIRADKNAILQVIYNLVDNAIKFSGKSRQIDIRLIALEDELQLSVRDYGIGISGSDQEKIFNRFFRADEPRRMGIKGSGIGLTIVKRIIEVHKGHLTLESRPGEGSNFCVHLPIDKNSGYEKNLDH
ncbi:MAG: HAMP domain-containing sensor histidine kinase [Bacteroidales bacterium]|nr:HAMP domain-containing sensor histidine kinase [Bacteroidales bacterium]